MRSFLPGEGELTGARAQDQSAQPAVGATLELEVGLGEGATRVSFLDPLIESWDIDLATFALDMVLNPRVVSGHVKRFEFIEREPDQLFGEEPGLTEFLRNHALSGTATEDEVALLKRLRFKGKRPTPLYYRSYRTSGTRCISARRSGGRVRPPNSS